MRAVGKLLLLLEITARFEEAAPEIPCDENAAEAGRICTFSIYIYLFI